MAKRYMNENKFRVQFVQELTKEAPKVLTKDAERIMAQTVREWVETEDWKWDGSEDYPFYTGTLHDSVAVRVTNAERNVAVVFMPRRATVVNEETGEISGAYQNNRDSTSRLAMPNRDYDKIVGWQYGRLFYGTTAKYSSDALVSWLTIGVPYAAYLDVHGKIHKSNLDHTDYAQHLQQRLYDTLHEQLKILGKKAYRLK